MKFLRTLLLITIAALSAQSADAKLRRSKNEGPVVTTIYAFGVSQNLSDSTVYITAIAPINGATLLAHNILQYRVYYSEQMKNYVEEHFKQNHQTVAFIYGLNRKKIEKKFLKVQANAKKRTLHTVTIKEIPHDDFHFKVPVMVDENGEF